jgi:hypothetical protein
MRSLAGLLPVWSGVLLLAGGAKLIRPDDTARALADATGLAGLRGWRRAVRLGAGAEVGLALWCLTWGGTTPTALVGASYAGFTLFVSWALTGRRPLSTCGCLGEPDTPPTWSHVVLCAAASTTAFLVAAEGGSGSLARVVSQAGGTAPAYLILAAAATYGVVLLLGAVPRLVSLRSMPR